MNGLRGAFVLFLAAAAFLLGSAALAGAQDAPPLPEEGSFTERGMLQRRTDVRRPARRTGRTHGNRRYLRSLDANHDGNVTFAEFLAPARKRFAAIDANRDGFLSRREYFGAGATRKGTRRRRSAFAARDANRDGRIGLREYLAPRRKAFATLDLNRDGVISLREAAIAGERSLNRRRIGRRARAKVRRGARRPYLASLDANRDGRIGLREYLAARRKVFATLDLNRNGVISRRERRIAAARRRARGGERRGAAGGLSRLDHDRDGRIDLREFLARRRAKFAELDADHDGFISRREAEAAKQRALERRARADIARESPRVYLSSVDANHDHLVTLAEYLSERRRRFAKMDLNRDGFLSAGEARIARDLRRARRDRADARRRARGAIVRPRRGGGGSPLARYDADGDGRVSLEEYLASRRAQFAAMDRNHDGIISLEEAESARRERAARRALAFGADGASSSPPSASASRR